MECEWLPRYGLQRCRAPERGTQRSTTAPGQELHGAGDDDNDFLTYPQDFGFHDSRWAGLSSTARDRLRSLRLLQQLVWDWQNPPPQVCNTSRFLLWRPMSAGIGSMAHTAAMALASALCTGRILYPLPGFFGDHEWLRGTHCSTRKSNWLLCYFQPITSCALPPAYQSEAHTAPFDWHTSVPCCECAFCHDNPPAPRGPLHSLLRRLFPRDRRRGSRPAVGMLVRYLLRPQPWFRDRLRSFLSSRPFLARPFASLHVRLGDKHREAPPTPLSGYMRLLRRRCRGLQRAFVSTETAAVLTELKASYPDHIFQHFNYTRIESRTDFTPVPEFAASFANLQVALTADCFVGSDSSNWCRLIDELQSTRPSGAAAYHSVDDTQYEICFP